MYIDASNTIRVDSISESNLDEGGDRGLLKEIKLNEDAYNSMSFAIIEDGLPKNINTIKKGDILTNLGNGLFVYSNETIKGIVTECDVTDDKIKIEEDEYIISENCICYLYDEEEPVTFNAITTKKLDEIIGTEATLTLNVAEEVCIINFGKTKSDNEKYRVGYITE